MRGIESALVKTAILASIIFQVAMAYAEDTEYEVVLEVKYNSVSVEKAAEIAKDAMRDHKDACSVDVKIRKPDLSTGTPAEGGIFYIPTVESEASLTDVKNE